MVSISSATLLFLASLLLPASAAPTRTHCRCVVVDANQPWTLSQTLGDQSQRADTCAALGPEIEHFRKTDPEVYAHYYGHLVDETRPSPTQDDMKPLTTTVLMELARRNALDHVHGEDELPSAPTVRPRERIICRSEPESIPEYSDSHATIAGLCVIVVMAVLACIAESVSLILRWIELRRQDRSPVQLSGSEKSLRAYCDEKKSNLADYDEYDDDEMDRPVM